jgi:hypothetical protein
MPVARQSRHHSPAALGQGARAISKSLAARVGLRLARTQRYLDYEAVDIGFPILSWRCQIRPPVRDYCTGAYRNFVIAYFSINACE